MEPRHFAQSVENLRKSRLRPEREVNVAPVLRAAADDLRRTLRGLGNVGAAWADLCPPALLERTSIESLHRNTLTVRVEDSAAKFVLDRWLREGGESAFLHACGAAVRRIKLVVGGEFSAYGAPGQDAVRPRGRSGTTKSARPRRKAP